MSNHKRRVNDPRKRRKGPTAVHGGTIDKPFATVYVPNVPKPKVKREPFNDTRSIAEVWGNDAPGGDMSDMRAKHREKIRMRQAQSMNDARKYLQTKVRAAVA